MDIKKRPDKSRWECRHCHKVGEFKNLVIRKQKDYQVNCNNCGIVNIFDAQKA